MNNMWPCKFVETVDGVVCNNEECKPDELKMVYDKRERGWEVATWIAIGAVILFMVGNLIRYYWLIK